MAKANEIVVHVEIDYEKLAEAIRKAIAPTVMVHTAEAKVLRPEATA